ncbi:hypothetical protein HK105_205079 [Polyrhizophydium stewartii]|uniref:Uncharacterized protein n=1 Tax=Polyrhizophydium stewartii TaxID=2732419 RepID=A0ABR4N7I6_9FUNG
MRPDLVGIAPRISPTSAPPDISLASRAETAGPTTPTTTTTTTTATALDAGYGQDHFLDRLLADVPSPERDELVRRVGAALVEQVSDLHREAEMLADIGRQYTAETEQILPPSAARHFAGSVLQQRIAQLVDRVRAAIMKRAQVAGGHRSVSASPVPRAGDLDAAVAVLRDAIEAERDELIARIEALYASLDAERDVRVATCKMGLDAGKSLAELKTITDAAEASCQDVAVEDGPSPATSDDESEDTSSDGAEQDHLRH